MNSQPVHFAHFNNHKYGNNRANSFTIAYRFLGTDNQEMEVAIAQCSKRDNFCKRDGRDLALTRLLCNDSIRVTPPRVEGKLFDFHNFMYGIIQNHLIGFHNKNNEKQQVRVW